MGWRDCSEPVFQLHQLPKHGEDTSVEVGGQVLAGGDGALEVEHLKQAHCGLPEFAPSRSDLFEGPAFLRVNLRSLPQCEEELEPQDPDAVVVHALQVLADVALVLVVLDESKSEGEGHPGGRGPIPGVPSQVRTVPLFGPSLGLHGQPKIDEREVRVPGGVEVQEHVVRGDVAVKGDVLQDAHDVRGLLHELPGDVARDLCVQGVLATAWQLAVDQLLHVHALVLGVADAVEPLVDHDARDEGHGQMDSSTIRLPHDVVAKVDGHLAPGLAVQRGRQLSQQICLEERRVESLCVLGAHELDGCNLVGLAVDALLNNAEGPTTDDAHQLEGAITHLEVVVGGGRGRSIVALALALPLRGIFVALALALPLGSSGRATSRGRRGTGWGRRGTAVRGRLGLPRRRCRFGLLEGFSHLRADGAPVLLLALLLLLVPGLAPGIGRPEGRYGWGSNFWRLGGPR
mmetsp:Transcript_2258/g.5355  ORF Transcript_2258/g.5355 Transcript_2258/m.5355 type:complete len:459 (-) Transcript_2258:798-2174(-)